MNPNSFLNKVRERPEQHRKRIALMLSGGVTLFLFAIWASTLPMQLASLNPPTTTAAVSASSPIDSLTQNFTQSYDTLKQNLSSNVSSDVATSSNASSYNSNGVEITNSSY